MTDSSWLSQLPRCKWRMQIAQNQPQLGWVDREVEPRRVTCFDMAIKGWYKSYKLYCDSNLLLGCLYVPDVCKVQVKGNVGWIYHIPVSHRSTHRAHCRNVLLKWTKLGKRGQCWLCASYLDAAKKRFFCIVLNILCASLFIAAPLRVC